MSPHALRQRMKHGNVYPPDRTQVALEKFFTESNLTALRELSLRLVARRVEGQLEDAIAGQQLPLVTDRVIVLVDGSAAGAAGGPAGGRASRARFTPGSSQSSWTHRTPAARLRSDPRHPGGARRCGGSRRRQSSGRRRPTS